MKGHVGKVNSIAFHPNGKILASCASDMTVKLWDLQTYKVYKTLQGHEHEVSSIDFMPGGDFLLSGSRDHTIKMWDTNTGFCVQTIKGHSEWVKTIAINSKGTLLASGSKDESIMIWNLNRIRTPTYSKDAIISILKEHEHMIDRVIWAPIEACHTIDKADYNKNSLAMLSLQGSQSTGDINGLQTETTDDPSQSDQADEESKEDVATPTTKLTTVEKLQLMRSNLEEKKKAALKKKQDDEDQEKKQE